MRAGRATTILLPAVCLLCAASWAATLGGLGGECILQDGGKQTRTTAALLMMKPELILDLKTRCVFHCLRVSSLCKNPTVRPYSSNFLAFFATMKQAGHPCNMPLARHLQLRHGLPNAEKRMPKGKEMLWQAVALFSPSSL